MDENQYAILSFSSVATEDDPAYTHRLNDVWFQLDPGGLGLFRYDRTSTRSPLADTALGLTELSSGTVRFQGNDWASTSPRRAANFRGEIGRFFGLRGWVNHLDIDENVTLRQRHHTRRPIEEIEEEARMLGGIFSLPEGIPQMRPAGVEPHVLQRAAAVRMLLGNPPLLVIDEPLTGLYTDVLEPLKDQVQQARQRGAAVLWISADPAVWTDQSIEPTLRGDLGAPNLLLPETPQATRR